MPAPNVKKLEQTNAVCTMRSPIYFPRSFGVGEQVMGVGDVGCSVVSGVIGLPRHSHWKGDLGGGSDS